MIINNHKILCYDVFCDFLCNLIVRTCVYCFAILHAKAKRCVFSYTYRPEVVRTRLRETGGENRRYKTAFQTASLTVSEEGVKGLYRGENMRNTRHICMFNVQL